MPLTPTIAVTRSELPTLLRALETIQVGRARRKAAPLPWSAERVRGDLYDVRLSGLRESEIDPVLGALTAISEKQIRYGEAPRFELSGVVYQREPVGQERWQTAREANRAGAADCEDLANYMAGSLAARDVRARAITKAVRPGLRHAVVEVGGIVGRVRYLDPSALRGMKGKG